MKVLIVGLGSVGQRHLRNLKEIYKDELEVYAIRKRKLQFTLDNKLNIREGINLDEEYNIKNINSLDEAIKENIKTIFITNPNHMHIEILLEAIENNLNVFVEKPLSHNLEQIEELQEKLKSSTSVVFVGFQNRYHPCIKKAKELLEKKSLGRIFSATITIGESIAKWHPYEDYRTTYAANSKTGGGVVLCQTHELDYLYSFLGLPSRVYAVGGKLSDLEVDAEDVSSALLSYEIDGFTIPVNVYQDYVQYPPVRTCKIIGTKGLLEFDILNSTFKQYDFDGNEIINTTYEFERNDMFIEELQDFIDATNKVKKSAITVDDGVESLRLAIAIKQSIQTGQIIDMKDI